MQIADLYRDRQMCPTGGVTREYHQQCATIHSTPSIINITNMNRWLYTTAIRAHIN